MSIHPKRKKGLKALGLTLGIIIFFSPFISYGYRLFVIEKEKNQVFAEYVSEKVDETMGEIVKTPSTSQVSTEEKPLPDHITIYVPFTVQAPNANWDVIHEESCEEASLLMINHYRDKSEFESKDAADQEILSLIDWETKNGYKQDVTVSELKQIAKSYLGISTGRIRKNPTVDDIKRELASGRPVIIPAAGRLLGNPNFTGPGPVYHMLVLKGYDANGFITNDPGTRKGQDFRYSFDTMMNAIHDWNASDINQGQKAYLVFD